MIEDKNTILHVPDSNWLYVVGRLKPGVSVAALTDKMSSRLREWLAQEPRYSQDGGASIIPKQHVVIVPGGAGIQNLQRETGKGLYLLMTISALVLLVACANIANLMLARGATRRAEISVRMALGAARARVIRQMLTESLLLACTGGLAGLAVAYAGTRTILALAFPDSPQLPIAASPSLAVLGFAFALSLLTGIVFGIVPAWMTSNSTGRGAARGEQDDAGQYIATAAVVDCGAGGAVTGDADECGTADEESAEHGAPGLRAADGEPVCAASGSGRRGL